MALYLKDALLAADAVSSLGQTLTFELKGNKIYLKKEDGSNFAVLKEYTVATSYQHGLLTVEVSKKKYVYFMLMKRGHKNVLNTLTKAEIIRSMESKKCLINHNT